MCQYHPEQNLLIEYAAGTLPVAPSIALKAHLHFCGECRHNIDTLNELGGEFINSLEPSELSFNFDELMGKIEQHTDSIADVQTVSHHKNYYDLPNVVQKLVPKFSELKWKKLNSSLSVARLRAGQHTHELALHRISAGGMAPRHDHQGNEITVVLKGSFSDEDGMYQIGDFVCSNPGKTHRPLASKNEECLCLSVLDAPVKLTGVLGRLVNPFLRTYPG